MENYIKHHPVIAILRGITPSEVISIAQCLYEHGIRVIEVPLNSPQALESIKRLAATLPIDCLVGAGTVINIEQAKQVKEAGGKLIISPHCDETLIEYSLAENLQVVAGVATPTEAFNAYHAGAKWLKLFPAQTYGYSHVKALMSVLPNDANIIAVGGVSSKNSEQWLTAGASALGIGNSLYQSQDTIDVVRNKVIALNETLGFACLNEKA